MKPTIQEVADRAGVGVGTVSRVLNNHPSVRPSTRQRVLDVMVELGYSPNPHARRIAGGRSYTVSVVLPFISTEFYARLLDGLERTLTEHRYDSALFPLLNRERLERYLASDTLPYQADGLVLATHNLGELYPSGRLPTRQPVVLVEARSPHYDSVFVDNTLGGRLAGRALAATLAPVHAFYVQQPLDDLFMNLVFRDRINGLRAELADAGRPVPDDHLHRVAFNEDAARAAFRGIMRSERPPVAVFAAADLLARGVLEECERMGLRPGVDVHLVGFDNHAWSEERGLTTVDQPIEAMGSAAAALLVERLSGYEGPPRAVRFEPALVVRRSARVD